MINLAIPKYITTTLLSALLGPPLMIILDRQNFPKRIQLSNPKFWHGHPYFPDIHSSHSQKIKKKNLSGRIFFT
jgi:hypothetical protein